MSASRKYLLVHELLGAFHIWSDESGKVKSDLVVGMCFGDFSGLEFLIQNFIQIECTIVFIILLYTGYKDLLAIFMVYCVFVKGFSTCDKNFIDFWSVEGIFVAFCKSFF